MSKKLFSIVCLLIACQVTAGKNAGKNDSSINDLKRASINEFPWLVSIYNGPLERVCTAVLINAKWALTTTSCGTWIQSAFQFGPTFLNAHAGHIKLRDYSFRESVQLEKVIKISQYEDDQTGGIALVKFKTDFNMNNNTIRPACFYRHLNERTVPFRNLVVPVWRYLPGLYGSPERSTFELVKSNYKDLSLDEDSYISTRNFGKITAKSVDGIPDFCPMGPLVYRASVHISKRGVHDFVVGMSPRFYDAMCKDNFNFIRISTYLDLIRKVIDGNLCMKDMA